MPRNPLLFLYKLVSNNVKMNTKQIILLGILALLLSCKTYTIPVDSFREQMKESTSEKLKKVEINHPLIYSLSSPKRNLIYEANNIKSIIVVDKNGNNVKLENSPKLEMRITLKNGKRNILLFDTVIIKNDTLIGARSRIIQNLKRKIPLSAIEKIEIQDSGKVYKYQ